MATYANDTNPFISPNARNNGLEMTCKKEAPGEAKPQSSVDNKSNSKQRNEANLMQLNSDCNNNSNDDNFHDGSSVGRNNVTGGLINDKDENLVLIVADEGNIIIEKSSDESDSIKQEQTTTNLCLNDSGEPAETVENLVEDVIRLEMDESLAGECEKNPDTRLRQFPSTESIKLKEDEELEQDNDSPPMEQDTRQHQHIELIKKLRLQLRDLEKYAYERGELDQVPSSVLAERQSVIIDTLKDRLSLNIGPDEVEKLELDELKKQVDKEIHDLIDPLITKEYLLGQLKTQLTDMERYIAHLHKTLGKVHDKNSCLCHLHGCSSQKDSLQDNRSPNLPLEGSSLMNNEALPKTSKLIRSLVTQLICSDLKLKDSAKKEEEFEKSFNFQKGTSLGAVGQQPNNHSSSVGTHQLQDDAAWTLHIDNVVLATDSLVNLFTLKPQYQRAVDKAVDEGLVESIVRRQLVPALRDLLSYGLIDPVSPNRPSSYAAILFDPYYILSSLTCFPSTQKSNNIDERSSLEDKIHVWNVIEEYYKTRNEPGFKTSSIKTLSQSFNLAPSISGPIKITSKQGFLIAIEDIIETMSKSKPNGPESHLRAFIYTALNRSKLPTWLRLIFRSKSLIRKYYHNYSFASQHDKMNKFLTTIDALSQLEFKLRTDVESIEQFINAF